MKEGDTSDPDIEDDEILEVLAVPMLPKVKPKRGSLTSSPCTTQDGKVPRK